MMPRRGRGLASLVLIAVEFGTLSGARAGQFEGAQGGLSKGYNDFYDALSKSSAPHRDAQELSKRHVEPAQKAMRRAMKAEQAETLRRLRVDPKAGLGPVLAAKEDGEVGQPHAQSGASAGTPPIQTSGSHPKTVLDGSQVPRELDFSAPAKK